MWSSLSFQDANSPLMEEVIYFHDHIMVILMGVLTAVSFAMVSLATGRHLNRFLLEGHLIEIIWTVLPAVILVFVALPSLRLLYLMDEVYSPDLTVKVVGHQWYWSYEYTDFQDVEFDSYLIKGTVLRSLDVDNRAVMPFGAHIRVLASSGDVIHSWTVPSLGVKVDVVPGRLNQLSLFLSRPGVFFGQCSEICGAQHSFMPIVVEGTPVSVFLSWAEAL